MSWVGDRAILDVDYAIGSVLCRPMLTTQTIEQRVTQLEAELERLGRLLKSDRSSTSTAQPAQAIDLPFGVFANDPYFDEILQRMREERELDDDNPAYV
jgi:hypothetical protein